MNAVTMTMGSASVDSGTRSSEQLFEALSEAATRLSVLEAQRHEAEESKAHSLSADVATLLQSVLLVLGELETSFQSPPTDSLTNDFADEEADTWVGFRPAQAQPSRIEDVCFMAGFELNRALRALAAATDADALLSASETGLRKLQRVLHAIMVAEQQRSNDVPPGVERLKRRLASELQGALAVRQLYVTFRRSLRRPENETRDAVLTALRYAAGGLATLAASPHYHSMRVSDRALMRRMRDRLLDWAHAGKPTKSGEQLLEDIFTCADLMRDINRRQELRAHDQTLMRELVGDSARDRAEWLTKLDRLAGLDDQLDALTTQLRASADMGPVIDILVRLSFLVR
jgi:hypothetical protein